MTGANAIEAHRAESQGEASEGHCEDVAGVDPVAGAGIDRGDDGADLE